MTDDVAWVLHKAIEARKATMATDNYSPLDVPSFAPTTKKRRETQ